MRQTRFFIIMTTIALIACQKEQIGIGENMSETFFLESNGAAMRIQVEGNTTSGVYLLYIHGGPGTSSYFFNTDYVTANLERNFAAVYWDQRNAGGSQGTSNADRLTLNQITEDLRKTIQLIRYRYGEDSKVFLLSHSFGGLIATSFMSREEDRLLVDGWIFTDGIYDYPVNDSLARVALNQEAQARVSQGQFEEEWTRILDFTNSLPETNFTFFESTELKGFATDAETFIPEVSDLDIGGLIGEQLVSNHLPLTSVFFNREFSANAEFNEAVIGTRFSQILNDIEVPVLVLYGRHDFITPLAGGELLFERIGSQNKEMVISEISGHTFIFQDETLFYDSVISFLQRNR